MKQQRERAARSPAEQAQVLAQVFAQVLAQVLAHTARHVTLHEEQPKGIVLYRHFIVLCSIATAVLSAASANAFAAESERCQELSRRFQAAKPQITAIEVSLALFSAADADCVALASELLDGGASVDARDRLGARPLSHAARFGNLAMVDLLLARGAPIDARNLAGATALYFAAEGGHLQVVQRLVERGADVKLSGRSGISPVAAATYAGSDQVVETLLAHGADERAPDETGKPPIIYAAARARLDIVKRLLARNVDVNARYPHDLTLLMWASGPDEKAPEADAIKVVTYLLDAGAQINDRDARGRTALMIAAEGGHAELVALLLERGADPAIKDRAGKRAADLTTLTSLRERLATP
jgi:ankyrin repeat protein